MDLFEQVAREELHKSMMVGDYTRAKQMRALMVVLPYTTSTKDDDNSIQELYTKAPVTRIIESEVRPMIAVVTQKPFQPTVITSTTRRTTSEFVDMTTPFKPLPAFDRIFPQTTTTTSERNVEIPKDIQLILNEMNRATAQLPTTTSPTTTVKPESSSESTAIVAPDVKNVLESLGLWVENERPMIFSKQTVSENFAPIELDFETGTRRTVAEEKPTLEQFIKKSPAPEIAPTDFVAFKPIPKLDQAEIPLENYEYFKSLGLLESPKESRSYSAKVPEVPTPVISSKAQGFQRRKSDVSYETDILKNISKQDREQLLDVLKKLESQVVAGKIGPNPNDHADNNLLKKDFKRQESVSTTTSTTTTTETSEPIKFSFNFDTNDDAKDTKEDADSTTESEVLSEDLPLLTPDNEGRIVNKGSVSADTSSESSATSTTTKAPIDAESFSLPPLDDIKLDNLEDSSDTGGLDPVAEAEVPPEKKNGFYFLADWNSFLEVGEGKDRVEVQFRPRVGDPRLFIPVTVP